MSECPDCQATERERDTMRRRLDEYRARKPDFTALVDQLVTTERRAFLAERILRDLAELEGHQDLSALVKVLQARIAGLEENVARLARRRSA